MEPQDNDLIDNARLTVALARTILKNGESLFPEHLRGEIMAALRDLEFRRDDMTRQLMRLCAERPIASDTPIRLVEGRLLYLTNESHAFAWGTDLFHTQPGFTVSDREPIRIIGGRPCWIEVSEGRSPKIERVVWGMRISTSYPGHSIQRLQGCGGVPCYMVNLGVRADEMRGFVVLDETEGEKFLEVTDLTVAKNRPLYIGHTAGIAQRQVVWETESIATGMFTSVPIVVDDTPHVSVLTRHGSSTLWAGHTPILRARMIHGPSIVNGKVAYALQNDESVTVMIGDREHGRYLGPIDKWWTEHAQLDNAYVAYSVRTDAGWKVFANGTYLCDGIPMMKGFSLKRDGITLCVQFETERHPREFDLRALGVLPAEPAAT